AVVSALVASIGAGSLSGAPATGATLRRQKMLAWVNEARHKHGVRPLKMAPLVVDLAHDHNLYMGRIDKLVHTKNLGSKLRGNWTS
ncbi:CAP domain-containing protein, partial [Salmonella sp. SAL4457]|uniref:CAP domain-containing protein n=1 Tax=Salmonella sp. SAL4457 TaxID=3159912 RepID=UPI00397DF965